MSLVTALVVFNILILVYQIIIEIFTVLCSINGISIERAKFQVISVLTGTGFTTRESEAMLLTKKRRRLTQAIMMFSYVFNISIVSIFVNVFVSTASTTFHEIKVGIVLTLWNIVLIVFLNRSKTFHKVLDRMVTKIANYKKAKNGNAISIYDMIGNKVIAEIELYTLKEELKHKTIEELGLKQRYNIQILVIKRKDEIISEIWPTTILQEGDVIILFGKLKDIKEALVRHTGKKLEKV